jgi:transposase-like protein
MQMPRARSSAYQSCRRWTSEEAGQALAALERSGLALTAFAIREGLDPQRLSRWRRRLAASSPLFEEIVASEVIASEAAISKDREPFEIVLVSGRVVRVPESFDTGALRRLLAVVDEERPC